MKTDSDRIKEWHEITKTYVTYEPHDNTTGTLIIDMDNDTSINPKEFNKPYITGVRHQEYGLYIDVENTLYEEE